MNCPRAVPYWKAQLAELAITDERLVRMATKGALLAWCKY
jgi:hypothetical protein